MKTITNKNWSMCTKYFSTYCTGEKFSIEIGKLESILTRIYLKYFIGKHRIRIERQKYPTKTVLDAIEGKLGANIGQ